MSGTLPYSSITGTPTIPTNFDSRYYTKDQLAQYRYRDTFSLFQFGGTWSYLTTFNIPTNYILQNANRPNGSHNYRWLLRVSGGDIGNTEWYWNGFIFYDQSTDIFFVDVKNGYPTSAYAFDFWWGSQGDNYLQIKITSSGNPVNHLNVNIS